MAPILTPTMPPRLARAASRASTAERPSLLKPRRLITASSASSRNTRGRGLPSCGRKVTVPISTKPKPSRSSASGTCAFLSKPAAMPSGLGKFSPKARTPSSRGSRGRLAQRHEAQRLDRQGVRVLGIDGPQQRARQAVEKADQRRSLRMGAGQPSDESALYKAFSPAVAGGGRLKVIIPIWRSPDRRPPRPKVARHVDA